MAATKIKKTKSTCGAATLLAAIFEKDPDDVKHRYGIATKGDKIRERRRLEEEENRRVKEERVVTLVCSQCGESFERPTYLVVHNIGRDGYQHQFCTQRCVGRWAGKHYGFAAHPENIIGHQFKKRKWNYEEVWAWHRLTGYGQDKLSCALGIPRATIQFILAKKRNELEGV